MPLTLSHIRTGAGLTGERLAVIEAPKDARPGSLASFTAFLESRGVHTQPGYDEKTKTPLLRLSNFGEDSHLARLLSESYPEWEKAHPGKERIGICVPHGFEAMNAHAVPGGNAIHRFLHKHAGNMAGFCYLLSACAMMGSAISKRNLSIGISAAHFIAASAVVMLFARQIDNPRAMNEILSGADAWLAEKGHIEPGKLIEETDKLTDLPGKMLNYIKKHPWEVNGALTVPGNILFLTGSIVHRHDHQWWMIRTLGGCAHMINSLLKMFAPQHGSVSIMGLDKAWADFAQTATAQRVSHFLHQAPILSSITEMIESTSNAIMKNPINFTSKLSLAGNVGLGMYGLAIDNHHERDIGMTANSIGNFVGSMAATQSSKIVGVNFDEIVTHAAHYIPTWNLPGATEEQKIKIMARYLSMQDEIMHVESDIEDGIRHRLAMHRNQTPTLEQGYTRRERLWLRDNPFLPSGAKDVASPAI